MKRIANPSTVDVEFADFWLAFDKKGEKIAKQIVENGGETVDDGKYDFPGRVHLFEHIVPDTPQEGDIKPWVSTLAEQLETWRERIQKMHSDYL
jgi:hypothetical protein